VGAAARQSHEKSLHDRAAKEASAPPTTRAAQVYLRHVDAGRDSIIPARRDRCVPGGLTVTRLLGSMRREWGPRAAWWDNSRERDTPSVEHCAEIIRDCHASCCASRRENRGHGGRRPPMSRNELSTGLFDHPSSGAGEQRGGISMRRVRGLVDCDQLVLGGLAPAGRLVSHP